jgi:UDP-GlcNAc:undecaprenyl-phosphate GlcNAc-1-phosphate transferase
MTLQLFAAALTSFSIAFLIVPIIVKYSLRKNYVDVPGRRKIHKKITPSLGGVAIFIGFMLSIIIWLDIELSNPVKYLISALLLVFLIGIRDDLKPLHWSIKLCGQILAATLVIFLFDIRIRSFHGLIGIYDVPDFISYATTYFTIIVITNSYNLIDGIDGLAGTLSAISLAAFGIWFQMVGNHVFATLAFAMLGGVISFLIFNWEPSEIFMGDTGALVVGLLISILSIQFIEVNDSLPKSNPNEFEASIGTAICFIVVPLIDTLRIFLLRAFKLQSPFKPDKSHIHHTLVRLGLNHRKSTIILGSVQLTFLLLAIAWRNLPDSYLVSIIIMIALILSILLDKFILNKLSDREVIDNPANLKQ